MLSSSNQKIAIVGDGSWATAIVHILTETLQEINWWVRKEDNAEYIKKFRSNPSYLTSVRINPEYVTPSTNLEEVVKNSDIVILVVPAAYISDALSGLPKDIFKDKIVVSAIKGMIPEKDILVTDLVQEQFNVPESNIGIISGPCHAEEVALGRQSYLTIAGENPTTNQTVADILNCRFVKVSTLDDLLGVEYAAVMKNVIALAGGIARGLNFGDNFQAVLVSNAMTEIETLVNHIAPKERDLNRSPYLGDLLVTAYSQFSRNRTFGNMIGRGYTVRSAIMELGMVAEGYYAVKSIHSKISSLDLDMPITKTVYNILYEKISPAIEFQLLKGILK